MPPAPSLSRTAPGSTTSTLGPAPRPRHRLVPTQVPPTPAAFRTLSSHPRGFLSPPDPAALHLVLPFSVPSQRPLKPPGAEIWEQQLAGSHPGHGHCVPGQGRAARPRHSDPAQDLRAHPRDCRGTTRAPLVPSGLRMVFTFCRKGFSTKAGGGQLIPTVRSLLSTSNMTASYWAGAARGNAETPYSLGQG